MARMAKKVVPRRRVYVNFDAEVLEQQAGKCEIHGCTRPALWYLSRSYDRGSQNFDAGKSVCEDHLKSEIDGLIQEAG
jgi:hypothetical protein